jgi:glucose/arabinose dehydrogenase/type 1 glutamine amidotransferase
MRKLTPWASNAAGSEGSRGPGAELPDTRSRVRRGVLSLWIALGLVLVATPTAFAQGEEANVLIYTGTTGFRHAGAIEDGLGPIQAGLDGAGISYDVEDCNGRAPNPAPENCNHPDKNPRIFTPQNLAQYDAIYLFNASDSCAGCGLEGPLWSEAQRDAIEGFVEAGGGIAANHNATDMAAGEVSWEWWDGGTNSAVGTLMAGHAATDLENEATVQVSDRHHPSTADLPDSYAFGDEHYNWAENVRGRAHVLATLDEESYEPGPNGMGQDHPISWCKPYDGGRVWISGMGHFGESYTENGGDNNLIKHLVGGVRWAAGEGSEDDCGGTIWDNFQRTVLSTDLAVGPIGLDVADDGKVYWTEIGPVGLETTGRLKMYDPETGSDALVGTIETRADHGDLSEDGVLGMALDPEFATNRHVFIYYSPRQAGPPGDQGLVVGHNQVSRFTLNADGTAIEPGSEVPILEVPKVKVGQDGDGIPGQGSDNHPGHVGGGGLTFDSAGDLYLAIGDDVNPFGEGGDGYSQIDQRYPERYDARNTSADTSDLRGKLLRITPKPDASGPPGVGSTYEIPEGNMFEETAETRPEIFAMGFRNPFTVETDPDHPGTAFVADYGPDAGENDPERGPAGIIEWNHIAEPGFYGWPFCTGDNTAANTYFRFTFPAGPSGEQFDCSAASIPNESPNNEGLANIPGPAVAADVWHKKTGEHPARFGLPGAGGPQEPNVGAVYDFDPDNPSETKWPAYYDESWLILDRSRNWWREVRLTDDRSELLRVNGFFQPDQFGDPAHEFPIPLEFGPDGSLYLALWTGGCCRDLSGAPAQLMRIDYVGDADDTPPPGPAPPTPPGQQPPLPGPSPEEELAVGIDKLKKKHRKLSKLLRGGVKVTGECVGVNRGKLKLDVGGKQARRLDLRGGSTVLAKRSLRCKADDTFSEKLKAKPRVKPALRAYEGKLKAKLVLRMSGPDGKARDRARVVLKG